MITLRCPRPSMARCSDWTSRRPWWITCWAVATTTCTSTSTMAESAPRRAPLMTLDEVLERLLSAAAPHRIPDAETLPTTAALGRVLGEDIVSPLDVPPADNSSMDGYALRVADLVAPGTVLPVSQRIAAGHVGEPLAAGPAARIFTGAQLPAGADAVLMQELCEAVDGGVRIQASPEPGQWFRRRGEDVRVGQVVLAAGSRLTPQGLGMLATVGRAEVAVVRRPRVALFSTGDELVMPGQPLRPGAIYNSNRYTLRGLLEAAGCTVQDLGIVPDRLDATREGLPGNPVSSFITFLLAVAPVLRVLQGGRGELLAALPLKAAFDWPRPDKGRREFMRVRLTAAGELELFPNQSSGVLTSAVWADGLVDNPAGQAIARGDTVRFLPLATMIAA